MSRVAASLAALYSHLAALPRAEQHQASHATCNASTNIPDVKGAGASLVQMKPYFSGRLNTTAAMSAAGLLQVSEDMQLRLRASQEAPPAVEGRVNSSLQKTFDDIYDHNVWGSEESGSGVGSEVNNTWRYRDCIAEWIDKYQVKTFLDIPCGDGNWQKHIRNIKDVSYYGYDISTRAVARAKVKNVNMTSFRYGVLDLVNQKPPVTGDVIMVKEVIQHLPLDSGVKMLRNAKASGTKYLIVTHCPDCTNMNIKAGAWFPGPDALSQPFNFDPPLEHCPPAPNQAHLAMFDLQSWNGGTLSYD